MIPMENESKFHWTGVGTLKITDRGLSSVSLRYMPDLSVIACELAKHRTKPSQEPHGDGEQKYPTETVNTSHEAVNQFYSSSSFTIKKRSGTIAKGGDSL